MGRGVSGPRTAPHASCLPYSVFFILRLRTGGPRLSCGIAVSRILYSVSRKPYPSGYGENTEGRRWQGLGVGVILGDGLAISFEQTDDFAKGPAKRFCLAIF